MKELGRQVRPVRPRHRPQLRAVQLGAEVDFALRAVVEAQSQAAAPEGADGNDM